MNPRQRRGVILMVIAVIGAFAVFISVLTFVSSVNASVGNMVDVVVLTRDVKAYQVIQQDMVQVTRVPQKWSSPTDVHDPSEVVGLVSVADLTSGSYIDRAMTTSRPGIAEGYREIAILVDAETGVGGKINSGDRVDIIATFAEQEKAPVASYVVSDALIIDVGVAQEVEKANSTGGFSEGEAVPVTFALPIPDALRLASAESFAVKVRLALRARNDSARIPESQRSYEEGYR